MAMVVTSLQIEQLHPHPDNPRKDVGDVSELAESIRKNGLLQNLTVIKEDDNWGSFTILIGHRRYAAAKMAGLKEVPCKVIHSNIPSRAEQIAIMLEENMQRNDLSIPEQAESFQMVLDLGGDIEYLKGKTGFSESTIRRRLELAKLDKGLLEEKLGRKADGTHQITLTDLQELEKLDDPEDRNKILSAVTDGSNIKWRVQSRMTEIRVNSAVERFKGLMRENGIKKEEKATRWNDKWEIVKEYDPLQEEIPDKLRMTEEKKIGLVWNRENGRLYIFRKAEKKKAEKTKAEMEREKIEEDRAYIRKVKKGIYELLRNFVLFMIEEELTVPRNAEGRTRREDRWKVETQCIQDAWKLIMKTHTQLYEMYYREFYLGGKNYSREDEEKAREWMNGLDPLHQMCVFLCRRLGDIEIVDYRGFYVPEAAKMMEEICGFFEQFGFYLEGEDSEVMDGTHERYRGGK